MKHSVKIGFLSLLCFFVSITKANHILTFPFPEGRGSFIDRYNNARLYSKAALNAKQSDTLTKSLFTSSLTNTLTFEEELFRATENATYIEGSVSKVTVSGTEITYTVTNNGVTSVVTIPMTPTVNMVVLRDTDGKQYEIIKGPPPSVNIPSNYLKQTSDTLNISDNLCVTFTNSPNQTFGFDAKEYTADNQNYEVFTRSNGKMYFIPYKSIGTGETDKLIAQVQIPVGTATLLTFKTKDGKVLSSAVEATQTAIPPGVKNYKLTNIPADAGCVYAYYNNKKIGKVNVENLSQLSKKIVLVPVNGANLQQGIGSQLNAIYKQANVSWSVSTAASFTFDLGTDGLEAADAGLMSKYSPEMQALKSAYQKQDSTYDKQAYYIFVVPKFSKPEQLGYMPRGKAAGFVSSSATAKTLAHELAHGAFNLEHTFPKIEEGSTNNLLDYSEGTKLTQVQWLNLRKYTPAMLSWFDEEEDGSFVAQILQCVTAAAVDVAYQYSFKFIELNLIDKKPTNFTDYTAIFSAIDKTDLITSAGVSCLASVLPWPTNTAKKLIVIGAAFAGGAEDMSNDVLKQYGSISKTYPNASAKTIFEKIDWGSSLSKAGVEALISAVATGVAIYAASHPKFIGFAKKLETLGYQKIKTILSKAGFTDEAIDKFCSKFGVKKVVNGVGKVLTSKPSWLPNRVISGNTSNPKGLLGVYNKTLPNGTKIQDTKNMVDELIFLEATASNFKSNSKDGFKMLNTPSSFYQNPTQFWTQYNKPWLDDLVANKADIIILSDKSDDLLKYQWVLENGQAKFSLDANLQKIKTGFGSEIEYMETLVQQGKYQWDGINGVYKYIGP